MSYHQVPHDSKERKLGLHERNSAIGRSQMQISRTFGKDISNLQLESTVLRSNPKVLRVKSSMCHHKTKEAESCKSRRPGTSLDYKIKAASSTRNTRELLGTSTGTVIKMLNDSVQRPQILRPFTAHAIKKEERLLEPKPVDRLTQFRALRPLLRACDSLDGSNPQTVSEYLDDICADMLATEKLFSAKGAYMNRQSDLNEKMRAILVDWITEVHHKFRLVPETLYLTINLIDRYLAVVTLPRTKL